MINNKKHPKNHRTFHFFISRFHRRSDLPFLGKFVVFELAAQASFKFSVKEMVAKRREKVKSGCLSFGYFSFGNAKKSNKQSGYSALTINKKRYKIATTQRKIINNKNLPKKPPHFSFFYLPFSPPERLTISRKICRV
ncbi:hypothetical protein ACLRAI_09425 [[Pasteurella] aerogenes]